MKGSPPFTFNLDALVTLARRKLNNRITGIQITLPFVSVTVNPDDLEQQVAREIVIRVADRRILNARECCDNCVDQALTSLQEIRKILVDQQVKLAKATDSPLFLVIEFMNEGIRQFLTFEQRLAQQPKLEVWIPHIADYRNPLDKQQTYFAALELLRGHLYRCLSQIAAIGQIDIGGITGNMRFDDVWQLDAYKMPPAIEP